MRRPPSLLVAAGVVLAVQSSSSSKTFAFQTKPLVGGIKCHKKNAFVVHRQRTPPLSSSIMADSFRDSSSMAEQQHQQQQHLYQDSRVQPSSSSSSPRPSLSSSSIDTSNVVQRRIQVPATATTGSDISSIVEQQQQQQQTVENPTTVYSTPSSPGTRLTHSSVETYLQKQEQVQQQQSIHSIASMDELLSIMDGKRHNNNPDNSDITVIKYYADYCKLCQRAGIQMKRLVSEFPTVDFTKIEHKVLTPPSAETLRSLGITKFPWIQIYHHGHCVASFSTGPSHMFLKKVRDTVTLCLDRTPEAWHEFYDEFASHMEENASIRQRLREGDNDDDLSTTPNR